MRIELPKPMISEVIITMAVIMMAVVTKVYNLNEAYKMCGVLLRMISRAPRRHKIDGKSYRTGSTRLRVR